MKSNILEKFVLDLPGYYSLNQNQQQNVSKLVENSKKFLDNAKIKYDKENLISCNTIILESGHQPNFFPHAGTWKKAFCLHWICNKLKSNGYDAIAFFGIADQNLSTARLLSKNQIPALNKEGSIKIGFKINDTDKIKSFCSINKPTHDVWQNEIIKIKNHYRDIAKITKSEDVFADNQWEDVNDQLWKSYELAQNFAELNGFIFAKLCNEIFGINLRFFLYSDMHHNEMFLGESREILRNLNRFNSSYNEVIAQKRLAIPKVSLKHMPFWYNCECGTKLDLCLDDLFTSVAICPICKKQHELVFDEDFQNLSRYYSRMDFNAVSRNIAMAQGLGDTLFISGFGGSLEYGQISNQISYNLGFHLPIFFTWRSRDYYLGMTQRAMVYDLIKRLSLTPSDLLDPDFPHKIELVFKQLSDHIHEAKSNDNQKDVKYWSGKLSNAINHVKFSQNIFSNTSSFLDIIANHDTKSIVHLWDKALFSAEIQNIQGIYMIHKDITYDTHLLSEITSDDLIALYKNFENIGVK